MLKIVLFLEKSSFEIFAIQESVVDLMVPFKGVLCGGSLLRERARRTFPLS
jgi:hypothetical protein